MISWWEKSKKKKYSKAFFSVTRVWSLFCTAWCNSAGLVSARKMWRQIQTLVAVLQTYSVLLASVYVFVCLTHTHTNHTSPHAGTDRQGSSLPIFPRSISLSADLTMCHIMTSSGGIIRTNAIYSILVSLTPDPGPLAAYPWQPCVKSGCAHWSHL